MAQKNSGVHNFVGVFPTPASYTDRGKRGESGEILGGNLTTVEWRRKRSCCTALREVHYLLAHGGSDANKVAAGRRGGTEWGPSHVRYAQARRRMEHVKRSLWSGCQMDRRQPLGDRSVPRWRRHPRKVSGWLPPSQIISDLEQCGRRGLVQSSC